MIANIIFALVLALQLFLNKRNGPEPLLHSERQLIIRSLFEKVMKTFKNMSRQMLKNEELVMEPYNLNEMPEETFFQSTYTRVTQRLTQINQFFIERQSSLNQIAARQISLDSRLRALRSESIEEYNNSSQNICKRCRERVIGSFAYPCRHAECCYHCGLEVTRCVECNEVDL